MDLAIGAKDVLVMMTLFTKSGEAKIVPNCSYPLTATSCVSRVYSDVATLLVGPERATVTETFGASLADLQGRVKIELHRPGEP